MRLKKLNVYKCILFTLLFSFYISAQTSISVDVNPAVAGIQSLIESATPNETFAVDIIGSGFDSLFSYQLKFSFDTSKFTFLGVDKDYGFTGTRNFLTLNGGSIQGICQQQVNPPCDSIIEIAYTIVGNSSSHAVSGEGLLGVIWLQSKLSLGESSELSLHNGAFASLNGSLELIESTVSGVYSYGAVSNSFTKNNTSLIKNFGYNLSSNKLQISYTTNDNHTSYEKITLFNLLGKVIEEVSFTPNCLNQRTVSFKKQLSKGLYLCVIENDKIKKNFKISIK